MIEGISKGLSSHENRKLKTMKAWVHLNPNLAKEYKSRIGQVLFFNLGYDENTVHCLSQAILTSMFGPDLDRKVKFFEVGGVDTMCAYSLEEAISAYEEETGINILEEYGLYEVVEISPEDQFRRDLDTDELIPFLEALERDLATGVKVPYFFASTEW